MNLRSYLKIAIFSCLTGIFTALSYRVLRYGMDDNSIIEAGKSVGLLFSLLCTPVLFISRYQRTEQAIYHPVSILLLMMALLIPSGIFLPREAATLFGSFLSLAGFGLFVLCVILFVKDSGWRNYVIGIPLVVFFSLVNTSVIFVNFAKPQLLETLIAGHLPYNWPTDALFHASIAQMINSYGHVSIGLDGPLPFSYHFGSHILSLAFANLLKLDLMKYYTLAGPIIYSPLYFFAFLFCAIKVRQVLTKSQSQVPLNFAFWIVFMALFMGFVKRGMIWKYGLELMIPGIVANSSVTASESYLLSLFLLFAGLTLILLRSDNRLPVKGKYLFYTVVVPALVFVMVVTKISTGFIFLCAMSYVYLRFLLFKKAMYNIAFILCLIGFYFAFSITYPHYSSESGMNLTFLKESSLLFLAGFFTLHYMAVYALIIAFLFRERITSIRALWDAVRERKTIWVEVSLVIALAGLLPKLVLNLGVNGVFFTEPQFFFSSAILLGYLFTPEISQLFVLWQQGWKRYLALAASLALCYIFMSNSFHMMRMLVDDNFIFRKRMVADFTEVKPRLEITKAVRTGNFSKADSILNVYGKPVQDELNRRKEYAFLKQLRELNNRPLEEKRETIVFIDQKRSGLSWGITCYDILFLVPSLSGFAQLKATLIADQCAFEGYGTEIYESRTIQDAEKNYSDEELCMLARQKGFGKVMVYRGALAKFDTISCR
jgi:hypothetical protein